MSYKLSWYEKPYVLSWICVPLATFAPIFFVISPYAIWASSR